MRTGAIFARGSCRELKWLALFGVVFALGAAQAAAQVTVEVPEKVDEGTTVTIKVGGTVPANDTDTDDTVTVSISDVTTDSSPTAPVTAGDTEDFGDFSDTFDINRPANGTAGGTIPVSGTIAWHVGRDPNNAEDEAVTVAIAISAGGTLATGDDSHSVTIEDTETQGYELSGASSITEGASAATTLTLRAVPPKTVALTDIAFGVSPSDPSKYTLTDASAETLAAGDSVTTTIQALADGNRSDDDIIVTAYGGAPLMTLDDIEISVKDIHGLPDASDITAKAYDDKDDGKEVMSVMEGGEVYIEVMVDRGTDGYPMGEAIEVTLGLSDPSLGTLEGTAPVKVEIGSGTGEKKGARVKLSAAAMDTFPQAGTLVVSFTASGKTAANGSGSVTGTPLTLTITDSTVKQVSVKDDAMEHIYGMRDAAKGSDDKLNPGDDFSVDNDMLFEAADGYTFQVDARSSMSAVVSVDDSDNVSIMPESAGTAMITLTATARPEASSFRGTQVSATVAEIEFSVTVEAPDAPAVTAKSTEDVMAAYMQARNTAAGDDGAWASNDGPATIMLGDLFDNLPATGVVADARSSTSTVLVASYSSSSGVVLTPVGAGEANVTVTANGVSVMFMATVDAVPQPAFDTRGRITAFSIAGTEEKTLDGVKRMHLTEGGITTASVTVTWTNQQLTALWQGHTPANPPPPAMVNLYDTSSVEDAAVGSWLSIAETNERDGSGSLGGNDVVWGARDIEVKIPKKPTKNTDSVSVTATATGTTSVSLPHDDDAEPEAFRVAWWPGGSSGVKYVGTLMYNLLTATTHVIEDDEPQGIKLTRTTKDPIYEGGGTVEFSVEADPRREDLPLDVRYDLTDSSDVSVRRGTYTLDSAIGTIPVGPEGKDEVVLNVARNDADREDDDLHMHAEVVAYALDTHAYGDVGSKVVDFTVIDVHKLPPVTVMPETATLMEGKELELTVTVDRNPRETRAVDPETLPYTTEELSIAVMASGASGEYSLSSTSITVPEYKHKAGTTNWLQPVKVTVEALMDEDVEADSMLMLDFVVNGNKTEYGPSDSDVDGQASVTIQDATATLVSVRDNAYDVIQEALGTPPTLTTGMSGELAGANLFDYDAGAVSVAYATSVDGAAVTASASGGTVTIMAASAGEAKVTITATATANGSSLVVNQTKSNVAQLTFPVMVEDPPLTFTVKGPDDMNLVEGGMGAMVHVMTNRAVTENTEVMLMRDGSSSASDDDFMLDPPLVTIMAGQDEGHTMVTAVEDGMMENADNMPEMLTLFLVVDGMQMSDQSVSFHLWDAAVPALPVIAQLLLAAFLAFGGYRRYRRR